MSNPVYFLNVNVNVQDAYEEENGQQRPKFSHTYICQTEYAKSVKKLLAATGNAGLEAVFTSILRIQSPFSIRSSSPVRRDSFKL